MSIHSVSATCCLVNMLLRLFSKACFVQVRSATYISCRTSSSCDIVACPLGLLSPPKCKNGPDLQELVELRRLEILQPWTGYRTSGCQPFWVKPSSCSSTSKALMLRRRCCYSESSNYVCACIFTPRCVCKYNKAVQVCIRCSDR